MFKVNNKDNIIAFILVSLLLTLNMLLSYDEVIEKIHDHQGNVSELMNFYMISGEIQVN